MQLGGGHTQSAANCIPPAEVALNLAVGDFERNGEMGPGEGGVERGKRERIFEYHCVKPVNEKCKTYYFKTMSEVRHGVELVAFNALNPLLDAVALRQRTGYVLTALSKSPIPS